MSLPRPRAADEPNRLIVSWNGSGRPSAVRAITSLSSTAASTGSRLVAATTSGTRSVTSARLRVKARTSSPERCTWSRAPSSFHSTPAVTGARERLRDVCRRLGQHRPDRAQHLEPEAAEALVPVDERRPRDDREVAREHVRPANVGGGEPGGLGDRVDHHTGQRALP